MGPLFFRAENLAREAGLEGMSLLQWGRSFSERRTAVDHLDPLRRATASMGPLFFRAENGGF